jgi:molybdopterin/thiamine biosynthesis adenylyltransferase
MIAIQLDDSRYERLQQISWWRQDLLARARVLVAGAGALGNEILKNLALLGVGRVVVVDLDRIELSNLSRSLLFRPGDLGQPKAEVAARRLREINPDVRVLPILGDLRWTVGLGLIRRMDVVLAGLDSVGARLDLNQMCWKAGVPWIDGALDHLSGTMRTFVPPDQACYECNLTQQDYQRLNARYSCGLLPRDGPALAGVPTAPTVAAMVGAWQVQEAVKWLHGQPVAGGEAISCYGLTHSFHRVRFSRRQDCMAHERLGRIVQLAAATHRSTVGQLLALLRRELGVEVEIELDRELVWAVSCARCGTRAEQLRPLSTLDRRAAQCPRCGAQQDLHLTHCLDARGGWHDLRLDELGVPPLHVLTAREASGDRRWSCELSGDAREGALADFLGTAEDHHEHHEHS